ncbi:transcription antitermination factor NusB [Magnetovibrio blakemorei]|uniref:Transcription antitermination protein NusB n=1 Tax=Magnetovibrio blakemorei TaxID=28181 RepID=A0A1E5Q4V5_9PROT|nr:transcription antitermination factor NusB [Magnetovibrio blakemorei]OEJ64613.1 transcription antitermination factor NusB [Magnetovibrio blakemorei]
MADTDGAPSKPLKFDAKGRSAARMAAVQSLYELDMVEGAIDPVLRTFIEKRWTVPIEDEDGDEVGEAEFNDPDKSFLIELVRGVVARQGEIDECLQGALGDKWTVERLEVLLRAILRCGIFELMTRTEIPAKVVINEYMDVANAFFSEGEPKMVNGVLDKLAHVLRDGKLT